MKFALNEIKDQYIRENFQKLQDWFATSNKLDGFVHFAIEVDKAETGYKWRHGLGYIPLDVIVTATTGAGTVTFNTAEFDEDYIDITTTDACIVRGFVGTAGEKE